MIRKENQAAVEATPGRHWFAISVKPRHEKSVALALHRQQVQEFLPLYRERHSWSDRAKWVDVPLFAGYVFCRISFDERLIVLNTRGVTGILGAGRVFAPVSEEQIADLQTIVASGLPARPCPYLEPGDTVSVQDGPLAGLHGRVLRHKGATSIVVSLEILQRSVAVELDSDSVRAEARDWRSRCVAS